MQLHIIAIILLLSMTLVSCGNQPNQQNAHLNEQGVFIFLGESEIVDDTADLPENIDPETVLCFGKGLKVGRCISKQLEKGICLGLLKHEKRVIAIEIPCDTMTQDTIQQEVLTE